MSRTVMPGFLPVDLDHRPLQVAERIQCEDVTSPTTIKSPATIAAESNVVLMIPASAVVLVIDATRSSVSLSLNVGVNAGVMTIPAGALRVIPCGALDSVQINTADDSEQSFDFWFECVGGGQ